MNIRIAIVQFQITHLDRTKNLGRIEDYIKRAVVHAANVIVFPEDCITGSIFGDLTKLDTAHEHREAFRTLAKKYSMRKNHLYPSEHTFLTPGTEAPVFETAYGKVGIVICWDMLFPEIFARMKQQGVEIIYCPSYWYREIAEIMARHNPESEEQLLDALCLVRSVETNAILVYCNAAGVMKNPNGTIDTLIGHSQAAMPVLGPIKRQMHNDETMFVVHLDPSLLKESREIYKG